MVGRVVLQWCASQVSSREGSITTTVRIDKQGRIVIPQHERERLRLHDGATLELIPTPEGVVLEHHRNAQVVDPGDGLPVIILDEPSKVDNDRAVEAIHRHRDQR